MLPRVCLRVEGTEWRKEGVRSWESEENSGPDRSDGQRKSHQTDFRYWNAYEGSSEKDCGIGGKHKLPNMPEPVIEKSFPFGRELQFFGGFRNQGGRKHGSAHGRQDAHDGRDDGYGYPGVTKDPLERRNRPSQHSHFFHDAAEDQNEKQAGGQQQSLRDP